MAQIALTLSIVIPTFNEVQNLAALAPRLKAPQRQIIIADGGSTDGTQKLASELGFNLVEAPLKGRAHQLNAGAKMARAPHLLFMHADGRPPEDFEELLAQAFQAGYQAGCFRLRFDWNHPLLVFSAYLTRFNTNAVRFGDQGFFVTQELWKKLGGYDTRLQLMEDQDIVRRVRKIATFTVLNKPMLTSARKYRQNGAFRLQWIFFNIWWRFYRGHAQQDLLNYYRQKIKDERQ